MKKCVKLVISKNLQHFDVARELQLIASVLQLPQPSDDAGVTF